MEDRRNVGENSCNSGDGTDHTGPILDVYDDDDDDIGADMSVLFYLHSSALQHTNKTNWIVLGLTVAEAFLTLFILYCYTHSSSRKLTKICQET